MIRKLARPERWWLYTWTIWGLIVAGIVLAIDRSALASLTWVAIGLLAAVFGQTICEWICGQLFAIFARKTDWFDSTRYSAPDIDTAWVAIATSHTLELVNPRNVPWEIYPAMCVGVGLVHGALVGTVFGSLLPVMGYPEIASFVGAWLGLAVGPVFFSPLYAAILPIVFLWEGRGPSVEPVRATVWQAAEEADQLGHELVIPAHLLLAILSHPTGQAALFFQEHEELLPRSANYLRNQLAEQMIVLEPSQDDLGLFGVLQKAISEAKARRHRSVGAAHLLLALLDENPAGTIDVLKKAGFTADELRPRIVASLAGAEP